MLEKDMVRALLLAGKFKSLKTGVVQREPYTFAWAKLKVWGLFGQKNNTTYVGVGFAKWNPEDRTHPVWDWNPKRGKAIAYVRAVEDLATKIVKDGNSLMWDWERLETP
jgi:hypothetical protein